MNAWRWGGPGVFPHRKMKQTIALGCRNKPELTELRWTFLHFLQWLIWSYFTNKHPRTKLKVRFPPSKCNTVTLTFTVSVRSVAPPPQDVRPPWPPCGDEVFSVQLMQAPLRVGKCFVASVCLFRPSQPSLLQQRLRKEEAGPMSSDCGSAAKCSTFLDVAMHQSQCPLTVR